MKHLLTTADLTRKEVEVLFERATYLGDYQKAYQHNIYKRFCGYLLGTVFFEPSTRTRVSFQAAAQRMGAGVVDLGGLEMSSLVKGESVLHTVRYMAEYADLLAIRHGDVGKVKELAYCSSVPVINAGDGMGQHPTQGLLDIYTMHQELKRTADDLRIVCCGDMAFSRTFNSLVDLLGLYHNVQLVLSGPAWAMPDANREWPSSVTVTVEPVLEDAVKGANVIYMMRPQKERHEYAAGMLKYGDAFTLNDAVLAALPPRAILMHPGPITDEIPAHYDNNPRSVYFKMARHGMHVRMAVIEHLIEENNR